MARCFSERTCICVNGKILKENEYEKGVRQQTREMIREINQTSERILEKNTECYFFSTLSSFRGGEVSRGFSCVIWVMINNFCQIVSLEGICI